MSRRRRQTTARERFDQIYETLRERICCLDYPPGARLSEEEVAVEFGVSRTPIRRVMARLETEGLVTSRVGVGTVVTEIDLKELYQIYDLRVELADLFGRLEPADPGPVLDPIRAIIHECAQLRRAPSWRELSRLNMRFFEVIVLLTDNRPLRDISRRLYYLSSRFWFASMPDPCLDDEIETFEREIVDVLKALELGDVQSASHIRRSHVSMSFRRVLGHARRRRGDDSRAVTS